MTETYYAHNAQVSFAEETTPGTTVSAPAHYAGHALSVDTPDESVEWRTYKAVGAGRDWNAVAEAGHTFEGSVDLILIKGDILFYALGNEYTTGTDDGTGNSDLNEPTSTAVGDTTFDVTDATGYAADDYIQVGTTTQSECRKITNVTSNTLTVDAGLRRIHADAETCNEVTSPYTHTLNVNPAGQNLKSFTMEVAWNGSTDIRRKFNGCYINTCELSCEEEGELHANLGIIGMNSTAADTSISTVTIPTTAPYMFDEGVITLFGGAIAQIKSIKVNINNNLKANRYIQSTAARNPYEIVTGNRTIEIQCTAVPQANTWTEYMRPEGQSATSLSAKFSRSEDDYIDIQATGVYMTECKVPIPEEGEIVADMTLIAKTCTIEVKDTTPYYKMV